jgi:4-amino-4-deoxy-L-arabinose transferase-like glycosyltransferase
VTFTQRLVPTPQAWGKRRVAALSLIWVCAALAYLAFTEWRVWDQGEITRVRSASMGSDLLGALLGLLIFQGVALLVFGFLTRGWPLCAAVGRPSSTELLLLIGVTAIAFVLRFAALQEIPAGLWFDTAENGNQALRILRDPTYRPVFIAEATQLPALFIYFDAASIRAFGAEAFAVRIPAALLGTATIPVIWWLGRQLGGPVLGLLAAFALATSRWHIDFSRLAISSIVTPLALALALAAALAALRAEGRLARIGLAIVAGAAISLGLWSYPSSVLIVPALAGAVAWWVARGWRQHQWRGRVGTAAIVLVVAAVACVVMLGPLMKEAIQEPNTVLQRSQAVAISGDDPASQVFQSTLQHVMMFTARGDRNGRHNTPGRPELGWFAPFFLAGVGAALWRFGTGISLAVPGALLLLLTGILTVPFEAPQSHRAIMAVVPAALLMALPIALAWPRHRRLAMGLIVAFVVAGCVETADYFRAQWQESSVYLENSLLETQTGRWLHSLGPDVPILADEHYRGHPTVRFLSGDHISVATAGSAVSEFLPLDGRQPVALIAGYDAPGLFERARALYPEAPVQTFESPLGLGMPLLYTMFVPQQLQQQTRGLLAESASGTVTPAPSVQASDAIAWSATMRVLRSDEYTIDAGGSTVAIDGQLVAPAGQPPATVFLARGAHSLRLSRTDATSTPQLRVLLASTGGVTQDVQLYGLPAPGGLLFTWQIEGTPQQAAIDSAPDRGFEGSFNNGRPWSAQWRGQLRVPQTGNYLFHLEAISSASLTIDDGVILARPGDNAATLSEGWHTIRVDYVDSDPYARLSLRWRPPDTNGFAAIPDELLQPALTLP